MSAVKIENLRKKYGSVHALDGLTMQVEPGSVFGFLGPNGAGKTTTLRILAGLASSNSGSIDLGVPLDDKTNAGKLARIGYLPEEPAFYPWMTPKEYLDIVGKIFKIDNAERRKRVGQLLEQSGLKDVAKRRIGGFSRGMRQRLGLAQSLVNHPQILLLDEPVSALDPAGRKEVLEMIEGLGSECTVIMSSHILADVERVCDTVGIINHGKLVVQAPKQELLDRYAIPALELTTANGMAASMPDWQKRLEKLPAVTGVVIEGYAFHIAVKDVHVAQQEIMQDALTHNSIFEKLEVVKPSLEDIFMQLTGSQK
ncbi:MAG: ABC transporter ATP-binding protein [Saprospiraceae bacterium]|nr:ABC transporter ATP-binding protein [Saprospiraceae bacterium]